MLRLKLLASALIVASAACGWAWEDKGHQIINRAAAKAMPADTPKFFTDATDRLAYLGPEPDRWRNDRGNREDDAFDQLYAWGSPDHFIDLEYLAGLDWAKPMIGTDARTAPKNSRYRYLEAVRKNVERLVAEKKFNGFDLEKFQPESAGFLPFRISEMTQTLRKLWVDWHNTPATDPKRREIEANIVYVAGVLGHYVADGANPHHTTAHYNGWDPIIAPNPGGFVEKGKPGNRNFHRRFEGEFVGAKVNDAEVSAIEAAAKAAPLRSFADIFDGTIAFLSQSNSHLIRLYELDKKQSFGPNNDDPEALKFAIDRMSAGAAMLRDLWAWAARKPEAAR